ncbi:MAG TPA: alpha-hydroxy acid oxidase [Vicinamibacterales bacterium]|nr:alpha-hydroxy acid oxidase [Vicinamibacterales bacterium]
MNTSRFINIADLRLAAKKRLPRSVFDYIDGGADGEITLRENVRAFEDVAFKPFCAGNVPPVDMSTTVLGTTISLPIVLAPVGSSRMFWPRGEEAAAAAAGQAGTLYCLSTLSGCRLEDVRQATSGPAWFQLYICGGREVATAGIQRAKAAGYSALAVTVDTAVAGLRERDFRNGAKELISGGIARLPYLPQFLFRPRWLLSYLRDGGLMHFPNVMLPEGPMPYADVTAMLAAACVTWRDLRWIRDAWGGPIIIKGVHRGEDAKRAIDEGAVAVVVSNHGGRQLDGAPSSISALPKVVDAVGGDVEILFDGGIRSGQDVLRALALGARACMIGRAAAYGVGAAGEPGVAKALSIIRKQLDVSMALTGTRSITAVGPHILARAHGGSHEVYNVRT